MLGKQKTKIPQRSIKKDCWHSYGLQSLSPSRFTIVVGEILSRRHKLITPRREKSGVA